MLTVSLKTKSMLVTGCVAAWAGLEQFDPDFAEAKKIEDSLGVPVLRHSQKKPAGTAADLEAQLQVQAHEMIMVGDRYLTDVLYGNLNGMLTVRVAPLTRRGESVGVAISRRIEEALIRRYTSQHLEPPRQVTLAGSATTRALIIKDPGVWWRCSAKQCFRFGRERFVCVAPRWPLILASLLSTANCTCAKQPSWHSSRWGWGRLV